MADRQQPDDFSDGKPTEQFNHYQQHHPHIHRPVPLRNFSAASYSSVLDGAADPFPDDDDDDDDDDENDDNDDTANPPSQIANSRSSDFLAQLNARLLRTNSAARYGNGNLFEDGADGGGGPPIRNKSLLNMTTSTLSGIYDEAGVGTSTAADTDRKSVV